MIASKIGRWAQGSEYRYYTFPLILWTLIMLTLSSIPGSGIPKISIIQWDKIAHFTEYAVFTILLGRYLFHRKRITVFRTLILLFVVGISYSIADELHQLFIPHRDCSWPDLMADILGVFTGVAGFKLFAIKDLILSSEKESV